MAKVPFTKLALSKNNDIKILEWKDQKIEIKQYLPLEDKLNLMTKILTLSIDDNVFYNPCKVNLIKTVEIILAYTNINVTEKQSEDIFKLYDLLVSSNFSSTIFNLIPDTELNFLNENIQITIQEIYKYKNSVMGVLEQINTDQKMTEDSLAEMINTIKNSKEIQDLQDITEKLD